MKTLIPFEEVQKWAHDSKNYLKNKQTKSYTTAAYVMSGIVVSLILLSIFVIIMQPKAPVIQSILSLMADSNNIIEAEDA